MRAGKLRHEITIQEETRTADDMGGAVVSWSAFASNVWADIKPLSAKERSFADKREHNITHKIELRFVDGVTSAMRVLFGSRVFQIHGVRNPDERGIMLELDCEEGVGA